jgi:hypothetical protein
VRVIELSAWRKRSKTWGRKTGAMPMPVSLTTRRATARRELDGIGQQVADDLLQPRHVALDRRQILGQGAVQGEAGLGGFEPGDLDLPLHEVSEAYSVLPAARHVFLGQPEAETVFGLTGAPEAIAEAIALSTFPPSSTIEKSPGLIPSPGPAIGGRPIFTDRDGRRSLIPCGNTGENDLGREWRRIWCW